MAQSTDTASPTSQGQESCSPFRPRRHPFGGNPLSGQRLRLQGPGGGRGCQRADQEAPCRPRKHPKKLHADKAYDFPRCREALRKRGITPRIARRGIDSSEKLGRYRWAVERTLSWVNRFRRLKVRYERRDDIHQAFLDLGCALICWRYVQRLC